MLTRRDRAAHLLKCRNHRRSAAGGAFFVAILGVAITEWAVWLDIAIAFAVPLFLASVAVARLAPIAGALQRLVFALVVFWLLR